jgi:hypothetical protein
MKSVITFIQTIGKARMLAVSLTLLVSCQSLDEMPSGIATPSTFYNTLEQCEAALAGAMAPLWGWYVSPGYGEGAGFSAYFGNDDQFEGGNLDIPANYGASLWTGHYKSISNVNALLAAIKGGSLAKFEQGEIDEIVAQAKFVRAFNYFYLVRMFGDLPLITEDTPDPVKTPLTKRTPVAGVYELIVSDFTYAMQTLRSKTDMDGEQPGRPTKGSAKGFLAKVYLTMATAPLNDVSKYADAEKLSKEIIDSHEYALIDGIWNVFMRQNKEGSETLFSFHSTADDPQTDMNTGKPGEIDGYDGDKVAIHFESTFADQPRRDAYILRYLDIDGERIPYTDFDSGLPYVRKLYNEPYVSLGEGEGGSSADHFILRYADILLIYAEASNRTNGGPTADGIIAINSIIDRANDGTGTEELADIGMTMQDFEDKVIQERAWELCFEMGDRWFDLVRKRILDVENTDTPDALENFSVDDYLFPIPDADAVYIGQNPGYEE